MAKEDYQLGLLMVVFPVVVPLSVCSFSVLFLLLLVSVFFRKGTHERIEEEEKAF